MEKITLVAITIHVFLAVIWVGGMFFAYMVLRPAMGTLEPPFERPKLWSQVFKKFFPWVWMAVIFMPITGYALIFSQFGGFKSLPVYINIMHLLGITMILIYVFLFMGPYKHLQKAVAANDAALAGQHIQVIRQIVGINLSLGLITIAIAASGRFW